MNESEARKVLEDLEVVPGAFIEVDVRAGVRTAGEGGGLLLVTPPSRAESTISSVMSQGEMELSKGPLVWSGTVKGWYKSWADGYNGPVLAIDANGGHSRVSVYHVTEVRLGSTHDYLRTAR